MLLANENFKLFNFLEKKEHTVKYPSDSLLFINKDRQAHTQYIIISLHRKVYLVVLNPPPSPSSSPS